MAFKQKLTKKKLDKKKRKKRARKLAWAEMKAMLYGAFEAVIKEALKRLADAHGLGLLVRGAEWALAGTRWLQAGEGDRQPLIVVPVPMGSVELDLSVRVGYLSHDAQPLITACFAPSSGPDPGVLVIDGCQISAGDMVEDEGPVVLVHLDLLQLTSREPEPRVRAEALMCLARAELLAELKRQPRWDELKAEGVECIVYYDQEAKESVWLFLGETEKQSIRRRITLDAAGRLIPYMIPRS